MRGNGKDRDLSLLRSIEPEYPVSARSLLLSVSLKDFLIFIVRIGEGLEHIRIETGMPRILQLEVDAFLHLSGEAFLPRALSG